MTGASPLDHGILDFTRRNPETGALEPITSSERRVPAIWNMADRGGQERRRLRPLGHLAGRAGAGAAGGGPLLLLHLARPGRRRPASSTRRPRRPGRGRRWPRPRPEVGLRRPPRLSPLAGPRRSTSAAAADPDPYAHPVSALRRILVETRAYHALATSWLAREKPDLAVVYFQGTDTLGHVFAPYAPPRQDAVTRRGLRALLPRAGALLRRGRPPAGRLPQARRAPAAPC